MFSRFERYIAFRYLRSKRKEFFISIITVISVLGVAISVVVLDITLAVMTGFERELQAKLVDANAHIVVRRYGGDLVEYREPLAIVRGVAGVRAAYPFTYNQAMISSEHGARGILVRGVSEDQEPLEKLRKFAAPGVEVEDLFAPAESVIARPDGSEDTVKFPPIIVGEALRERMSLDRGDLVTLFAPSFTASPQGLTPKLRRFAVLGHYRSGLVEYESGLAYTSLADAQHFFGMGNAVTGIEVSVGDLFRAPQIAQAILEALGGPRSGLYVTDWTEQNKPLWDAIRLEKRVYFIVLLLLTLVASFSIVSTLVMVVMEKTKDIAILKSMGASDFTVLRIFLLQGATIGAVGVVLGTIMGYLGCIALREYGFKIDERVFSLDTVPVEIVPENMLTVAAAALLITALTGLYPAYRASKLRPADALRFE
ncbi:MAG: ABC transporter permease [Bdellovibrionales bacterium]|nr:ABC transporter permease [Bdellovibrionales bacterium]